MSIRKPDFGFIGHKQGKLTVVEYLGNLKWLCECECGETVDLYKQQINGKNISSCGCLYGTGKPGRTTTGTPERNVYNMMRQRCNNPNYNRYHDYGGRGITVCERWLGEDGFRNFLSDMGKRPTVDHLLDRIDNSSGYSPENCEWRLPREQMRNTRRNINITFRGKTQCLCDWADELGIHRATLAYRVKHWSIEKALTTPVSYRN